LKRQIAAINDQIQSGTEHNFLADVSYPKTVFLGTSSSNATSYRNVTAIMLQLNEGANMMLDCGEGTSGQLFKLFGVSRAYRELAKIKLLFLTHIHLDHHGGVFGLVLDRINAFAQLGLPYQKLKIMIPKNYVEQCIYCEC
jgi:ribonuclease Z